MASANTGLYGVERQALEVLRKEYEKYQETQQLTSAFVQLLRNTHEMVLKGAKQRAGIETAGRSPREILVELQQLVVEFQQLVDQENELSEQEQDRLQ